MSGQLFSLENKALNELEIIHKVVKDLDYVEFKYIVKSYYQNWVLIQILVLVLVMTYQLKNVNYAETQNYVHSRCHRI